MVPAIHPSLFDPPGSAVLAGAIDWMTGTLLGSLAIGLCIIAVGTVGLMLLSGRIVIREAARVVLGCFILLGAPVIASAFNGAWQGEPQISASPLSSAAPAREPLPQSTYDPYAGASLRQD